MGSLGRGSHARWVHVMSLMQQNSCSKGILMELIILLMEQGKLGHPSTQHEGPRCQDHASMNTKVLVDPLV
jgi:hypothetical protein